MPGWPSFDADIVKLATMANTAARQPAHSVADSSNGKVPTVGICMGDIGTPSRILAGKFGRRSRSPRFITSGRWRPGSSASRR